MFEIIFHRQFLNVLFISVDDVFESVDYNIYASVNELTIFNILISHVEF